MYKMAKPFFVIVQTPLHAGSGSSLGIVEMPIQRERHNDFPKIEGSSLKGAIREVFEEYLDRIESDKESDKDVRFNLSEGIEKRFGKELYLEFKKEWKTLRDKKKEKDVYLLNFHEAISLAFGPEDGSDYAGALGFTDARILLFPVKSMRGLFAWITCPEVLKRFKNDLMLCKDIGNTFFEHNSMPAKATVADTGSLLVGGKVILEEYSFEVRYEQSTQEFAKWLSEKTGIPEIKERLVVLDDEEFRDFVNLSTEVITRTKINSETGIVQEGALFTEEYLPSESVMYSLSLTSPPFGDKGIFRQEREGEKQKSEEEKVMDFFVRGVPEIMQIGGNATLGKGIVKIRVWEVDNG